MSSIAGSRRQSTEEGIILMVTLTKWRTSSSMSRNLNLPLGSPALPPPRVDEEGSTSIRVDGEATKVVRRGVLR